MVFLVSMLHTEFSSAHIALVCIDESQLFFAAGNGTAPNHLLQIGIAVKADMLLNLHMSLCDRKDENRGTDVGEQLDELATLRAHDDAPVVRIGSRALVLLSFDMIQTVVFITAIAPKRENVLLAAELAVFPEVFKLHERKSESPVL